MALIVMLAACQRSDVTLDAAEQAVRARLVRPDTARFEDVTRCLADGAVMGRVDAENVRGQRLGAEGFYYVDGRVTMASSSGTLRNADDAEAVDRARQLCFTDAASRTMQAGTGNVAETKP